MSDWTALADLRDDARQLWPDHPWPETVVAAALIDALARIDTHELTAPPF